MSKRPQPENKKHPGGRHLSTLEILCVCILFLVGYLVISHQGKQPSGETQVDRRATAPVASPTPPAPAKRTAVFQDVAVQGSDSGGFRPRPTGQQTPTVPLPQLLAERVANDDTLQSVTDTGTGTVSVVYTDGHTALVPVEAFLGLEENRVQLTSSAALTRSKGLFRTPTDDLRAETHRGKVTEIESETPRSVQLGTFKRTLAEHGKYNRETREALANLVPEEMPIAMDTLDQLPWNADTRELVQLTMAKWGQTDPMAALAHAETYDSLRKRNDAVNAVLNSYAKTDPEGALSWYFSNLETDPRTKNFNPSTVFRELAREDFNHALARVNQIDDLRIRQSSLKYMLGTLEQSERLSTIEHMFHQSQSVNDQKMFATEYVMSKSRYEPYEAANWIASNLQERELQASAIDTLVYNWSTDRPDQAADWVMRLADDEIRQKQLTNISRNWSRYDPEAAEAWLDSFPPDPDMDGAVSGHISTMRKEDPALAAEWIPKIADPKKRLSVERSVARDWIKTDPEAARQFILNSGMDEKYRNRYLEEANQAIAAQLRVESTAP